MLRIRKFSLPISSILVLVSLALSLSLLAGPNRPRATLQNSSAPMMAMPLVAPLFLEDPQFNSILSLVNISNLDTYATVTVRSLNGQSILQKQIPIPPSSPTVIGIQQLLQEANSTETRGSLVVEQSPELKGMVVLAQLSITYQGSRASYVDEELAMPDPNIGSSTVRAVARGKAESTLIAISSLSQTTQKIQIDCLSGNANRTSKTLDLPASATVVTNACAQEDLGSQSLTDTQEEASSNAANAAGFQLTSNAGPAQFAAFGLTRLRASGDVHFGAVPFNDPKLAASSSTVFVGLPVGPADLLGPASYLPYVALANFSLRRAHVTVTFSKTYGVSGSAIASATPVADAELQPQQTKVISLSVLQGDPSLRNSFVVTSDVGPGEMIASMASKEANGSVDVELLGKDAQQPENAGGHPWSVAQGNESTLLIFNHTDMGQRVKVNIPTGKGQWEKLIKLSPFETLSMSMSELIKNRVKDDNKLALPPDLVRGEIVWTMANSKTTTGRLLVSNDLSAMARNFSCSANYNLCGCSISPTSATIAGNGYATFSANPAWCFSYYSYQCTGTPTGNPAGGPEFSWWPDHSEIIDTTSCSGQQNCSPTGSSGGTTALNLQASLNGCVFGPPNVTPAQVTVVTATVSQRTSGTVSSDDAALANYQGIEGTSSLGPFIGTGTSQGCFIGYETIGNVSPNSYTGNVILHRTIVSDATYTNSTSTGGEAPGTDDTSHPALRDDNPQSGGSNGKVYDLDAPGATGLPVDGNTYRLRTNFYAYAALPNGLALSSNYSFFIRVSCKKTSSGYQFVNDVAGDNQIGPGTTRTTWNLQ